MTDPFVEPDQRRRCQRRACPYRALQRVVYRWRGGRAVSMRLCATHTMWVEQDGNFEMVRRSRL